MTASWARKRLDEMTVKAARMAMKAGGANVKLKKAALKRRK
jgi:hypothetical protein